MDNLGDPTTPSRPTQQIDRHVSIENLVLATQRCDTQSRMDMGDHRDTTLEIALLLAGDECADVRLALAENHNLDESVLILLTEDSNPYVAHRAQKTLARLREAPSSSTMHPALGVNGATFVNRTFTRRLGSKARRRGH